MRRAAAATFGLVALAGCGSQSHTASESRNFVSLAKAKFADARARGVDMSRGPCLGTIAPDWVADVAHDPRRVVDDLPQNQCSAFRAGMAHHFVELDPEGALIRKR